MKPRYQVHADISSWYVAITPVYYANILSMVIRDSCISFIGILHFEK